MDAGQIIEILVEAEEPGGIEQKPTVDFRLCRACSSKMRDRDKFCRQCGARQTGEISPPADTAPPACATSRLRTDACCSVSASLLTGIAAGAQAGTAGLNSRFARCVVSALITVPLWMMIMLLSPFDAYATAKAIANQH
jgi:hypothetical protein